MGTGNYEFDQIVALLPEGWQEKAKELGALERVRKAQNF
jgi:hypothetical protein